MCVVLYTQYFPESCKKKIHRHSTRVGFEPTTFAILEQCLPTRPPRLPGSNMFPSAKNFKEIYILQSQETFKVKHFEMIPNKANLENKQIPTR